MYVCLCHPTTEAEIRHALSRGATSVADLVEQLGAGTVCGQCRLIMEEIVAEAAETRAPRPDKGSGESVSGQHGGKEPT